MTFVLQFTYVCLCIKKKITGILLILSLQGKLMTKENVQWLFNVLNWEGGIRELNSKPLRLGFEGPPCRDNLEHWEEDDSGKQKTLQEFHAGNWSQWGWKSWDTPWQWDNEDTVPAGSSAAITTTQGRKQREEADTLEPESQVYWQELEPRWACDQDGSNAVTEEKQQLPGRSCPVPSSLLLAPPAGWAQLEAAWSPDLRTVALIHCRVREGWVM